MGDPAYEREARELHERVWRLREVDEVPWHHIADRLGIAEPRLAKIRKAAVDLGLAVKRPNGRACWRRPEWWANRHRARWRRRTASSHRPRCTQARCDERRV